MAYAILNSPIPAGGFGRPLTRTERASLIAAGVYCRVASYVVQAGADHIGHLYEAMNGSLSGGSVRLTTR